MSLACRVHGSWVDRTGDTVTVKQSQRRVTSPSSKMFRQHLKCRLTAPRRAHAGTSFGFSFVSFYSASCLSLGDLAVSVVWASQSTCKRHDLQRLWYLADGWLLFIFNLSNAEELGRVGERSLGSGWTARLSCGDTDFFFFFFLNAYAEERTRREGRQNSPLASQ